MALLSSRLDSSLSPEDLRRVVEQIHETLKRIDEENRKPKARVAAATATPTHKLD